MLVAFGQARDKGPVDLDLVEREAAQVAERGIAGAEIVHRYAYTELLELMQDRQRALAVLHEDALGDLELEAIGRETRGRESTCDGIVGVGGRVLVQRKLYG